MNKDEQILKARDDKEPVLLTKATGAGAPENTFQLGEGRQCSWLKNGESVGPDKLRLRIEPWLTALFQSEHLGLLVGSGLTHAVHHMVVAKALPGMNPAKFAHHEKEIAAEAEKSAAAAGRDKGNIEDQLRVANEVLRGLEILSTEEEIAKKASDLRADLERILGDFAASILQGENGIITAKATELEKGLNYLVSFLMSFASRTGTRDRLQIFTTNYDRLIELGAEVAGLHLMDRFVGSLTPIFRSSRLDVDMHYNPPGIRGEPRYLEGVARFTKLHGAVDWVNTGGSIRRLGVPFGALTGR